MILDAPPSGLGLRQRGLLAISLRAIFLAAIASVAACERDDEPKPVEPLGTVVVKSSSPAPAGSAADSATVHTGPPPAPKPVPKKEPKPRLAFPLEPGQLASLKEALREIAEAETLVEDQSFRVDLPGFEGQLATSTTEDGKLSMRFTKKGAVLLELPQREVNAGWKLAKVAAISFTDVTDDDRLDVLLVGEYGMGDVTRFRVTVWVGKAGEAPAFELSEPLSKRADDANARTIAAVQRALKGRP